MSGDRTSPNKFEIIASTRRRWSAEQKRAIVNEIAAVGGSVSEVARRHGVHASQLFRWRRNLSVERGNGAVAPTTIPKFLPVRLPPPRGAPSSPAWSGAIEIALAGGCTIRVGSDVDTGALVRIIEALEERR
jgi:transposase